MDDYLIVGAACFVAGYLVRGHVAELIKDASTAAMNAFRPHAAPAAVPPTIHVPAIPALSTGQAPPNPGTTAS